ncbi:MAG: hypothetical protein ABEK50_13675, partial [bacterium]
STIEGAKTHLLAGNDEIIVHYQETTHGTNTMISYDQSGNRNWVRHYPDTFFVPTLYDDNTSPDRLYAGTVDGEVRVFNAETGDPDPDPPLGIADSDVRVTLQGENGELYVATRERDLGGVVKVNSSFNDTAVIYKSTKRDTPIFDDLMTRPVWLKKDDLDGYLGMISDGATFKLQTQGVDSDELRLTPWPHEDQGNQKRRQAN